MLQWFRDRDLRIPNAICDNSEEKQGSYIEGIPVISFQEALERFTDLEVLITSTRFGNEIEEKVTGKMSQDKYINLQKHFLKDKDMKAHNRSHELQENINKYIGSLRGENEDKFILPMPKDMPQEAKEVVKQLKAYREAYERGEDFLIEIDDYFVRYKDVDFWTDSLEVENMVSTKEIFNKEKFNDVYKIGNHLVKHEIQPAKKNFGSVVKNIVAFSDYLSKEEIPFLYVQLPNKLSNTEEKLPKNLVDEQNPIASCIVEELRNRGISCFDYRKIMKDEQKENIDYFYKSDNHWKTELAFKATKCVCEEIERLTGMELDRSKFVIENYDRILYKDIFLGQWGQTAGLLYGWLDDYELILPKYETDYSWGSEDKGFYKRGNAREALLAPVYLGWEYYGQVPYAAYSLNNKSCTTLVNYKNLEGKKLVCLHDSFAMPMSMFLAPHFSELHFFSLRENLNKKYVFECIERIKPDIVMMAYWPNTITNISRFSDVNPYED